MHNTNINQIISNPVEEYDNLIEICRSFIDAAKDGSPNGKKASANKRFKVKDARSAGYDSLGHHDGYELAGVLFDHYECGVVDCSYPLSSNMSTNMGVHSLAECVVFMVVNERHGINLFEYANEVLERNKAA